MTWTNALIGFLVVVIAARWLLIGGDEGISGKRARASASK
jgi:hypothetical protein